jgi:hypothetical protein
MAAAAAVRFAAEDAGELGIAAGTAAVRFAAASPVGELGTAAGIAAFDLAQDAK